MATVLLWSGAGAADLGEADIEETAPAAAVEWSEVDTAPQAAPAPRSRLEQLMAEQAEGAARGSAPAVVRAEASPASAAASRAPIMPIIKKAVVERPAPAPGMLTLASNIQPAVLRRPPPSSGGYAAPSADPNLFGSTAMPIGRTSMDAKWSSVSRSPVNGAAAGEILAAAKGQGDYARLERVNIMVNRRITFTDDARAGSSDYWSNADDSLRRGAGDCEDYAIAKLQVLRTLGVDERDLYLVLVRDLVRRADHAILVVHIDGRFVVLDNNTDRILPAEQIQDYRPQMSFSGGKSWIHGYREQQPRVILASTSDAEAGL